MNKPTPQQLADLINEDEYGLPVFQPPGEQADAYNVGPEFDQGAGPEEPDQTTVMRTCAATSCVYNQAGLCELADIEINERGGCGQYEASADDSAEVGDSRYEEQEADVTGGNPQPTEEPPGDDRHWQTGRWDPKGGGY